MAKALVPVTSAELTDFSPSRLTLAGKCGLAFEYRYIRGIPAPYDRGAQLFGNAVHYGLAEWYGLDNDHHDHQSRDLAPIICAQWEDLLPPVIWERVQELVLLNEECDAIAAAIQFKRPTLKMPTQTQEYLSQPVVKEFNEKRASMIELCDKLEEVKWPKDEDPYKAYVKAAEIGREMQRRWQPLPRPVAVERSFSVEIEGFRVRGQIDQLRADPMPGTGAALVCMVDVKTGRQPLTAMEAFLQSYLYTEAVRQDPELPDTDNIAFYLARHGKYQQGKVDRKRHRRLASRILNGRARQITMGQFEPSYGHWCKQCDFEDLCTQEVGLWDGDGLTVELMA